MKDNSPNSKRLIGNQKNLLEAIPEMVLLVKDCQSVEYMNPSAVSFFGNLNPEKIKNKNKALTTAVALLKIVEESIAEKSIGQTLVTTLNQAHLEYTLAPFKGYKGDDLFWFFIRDLTEYHNQLEELALFHN